MINPKGVGRRPPTDREVASLWLPAGLSPKILDPKHLELAELLPRTAGELVQIAIVESDAEEEAWKRAAIDHFVGAYDDQDAIYDEL